MYAHALLKKLDNVLQMHNLIRRTIKFKHISILGYSN